MGKSIARSDNIRVSMTELLESDGLYAYQVATKDAWIS
jgi:hypothetical protein